MQPAAGAANRQGKVLRSTHRTTAASTATETLQEATTAPGAPRNAQFTDADIAAAWDSYAHAHPTEHVLVNTIRSCRPVHKGNGVYDVAFENEIQLEDFNKLHSVLVKHLRDAVGNDSVELTYSLSTSGPAPHIWNDQEILHNLRSKSPEIVKLIERFHLKPI